MPLENSHHCKCYVDILRLIDFTTPHIEIGIHKNDGIESNVDTPRWKGDLDAHFIRVNEWNSWKKELQINMKKKNLLSLSALTCTRSRETKTFGWYFSVYLGFYASASQFITSYELIVIECLYKSVFSKTPSTTVLQETRKTIHITNRTSTAKLSEATLDEASSRYTMGWFSVSMEPVMTRENGYIERTSHSHLCFRLQPIRIHINSDVSIAVSLM